MLLTSCAQIQKGAQLIEITTQLALGVAGGLLPDVVPDPLDESLCVVGDCCVHGPEPQRLAERSTRMVYLDQAPVSALAWSRFCSWGMQRRRLLGSTSAACSRSR
jgi:hypothetical protein